MSAVRVTLRWDAAMGCYRVSEPNIDGPVQLVTADAYDHLRAAGEAMFRTLVSNLGCGHTDPRHPSNTDCPYCHAKGNAMNAWDDALLASHTLASSEDRR